MKRFFIVVLVVLVALAWTNPGQAAHQRAFADQFKAKNPVLSFFGVNKVASEFVAYDSYVLFSVGKVAGKPVSIGLLGKVFAKKVPIESEIGKALRGT